MASVYNELEIVVNELKEYSNDLTNVLSHYDVQKLPISKDIQAVIDRIAFTVNNVEEIMKNVDRADDIVRAQVGEANNIFNHIERVIEDVSVKDLPDELRELHDAVQNLEEELCGANDMLY